MENKVSVLTALVIGATVGGVLGILFAPDKGEETRKKLTERGKKFSDGVMDKVEEGKKIFNNAAKNGKEELAS